jgi:hypothetical protein
MGMLENSVKWEDLDFNEFDVYGDEINLGYDYDIKVCYECVFKSKYNDNYDGFIYDGSRFIECSNGGESVRFNSLNDIKNILCHAKDYWNETDLLAITKYIDIEKDDELIVGLHTQYKYVRV